MRFLLCFLCVLAVSVSAENKIYEIEGEAFSLDDPQRLVYREKYTYMDEQQRVEVDYFTPEGDLFAYKALDFSHSLAMPSYTLSDTRDNSGDGARLESDSIILFSQEQGKRKQKQLHIEERQVIDAGFPHMVVIHWQALLDGEIRDIHFAFADRLRNVRIDLQQVADRESPLYQPGKELYYFSMSVSSRFLALFADPVHLAFDNDQRLIIYYGRSNLADDRGKSQDVMIRYSYNN